MNSFLGKVSIVFSKKETFGQRLKKTLPGNYRNGEVTGAYSETAREKASWMLIRCSVAEDCKGD